MKLVPTRIDGASVTCGAWLDSGSFYSETWTHTDEDGEAIPCKDPSRYLAEFVLLAAAAENLGSSPSEYATGGRYVDPETGVALTVAQAKTMFAEATPEEEKE